MVADAGGLRLGVELCEQGALGVDSRRAYVHFIYLYVDDATEHGERDFQRRCDGSGVEVRTHRFSCPGLERLRSGYGERPINDSGRGLRVATEPARTRSKLMTWVFSPFDRSQANSEQKGNHNDGRFDMAAWSRSNPFHGSGNVVVRRLGV